MKSRYFSLDRNILFSAIFFSAVNVITACGGGSAEPSGTQPPPPSPPPANSPTLIFTANNTTVSSGNSVTLSWTTSNADSCTATGAWSGSKIVNGSEVIASLTADSTFQLSCSGNSETISRSVTIIVTGTAGSSLSGTVDSSLVDRFGLNKVYIFEGTVTPDDADGIGVEPLTSATVTQVNNACTWSYAFGSLNSGTYTVAFTNEAAYDDPAQNDSIQFIGTTNISVGSGSNSNYNFAASNVLRVGPTRTYQTPSAAEAVANDGDVIEIDAGVYMDDITVWRQNNITLRGVGGRAHLQGTQVIPFVSGSDRQNGKGIWVIRGNNISVENIEFSGARVTDLNGAGIRNEGNDLSICNSYFHDNENGILGGAYGSLLIEYSEFDNNGLGDYGRTHNLYIDGGDKLIFRHNYSHHANIGHNLKTRASENYILYNRLMDEATGNSSYAIDVPNGGLTYIIGNLVQQGVNTDNSAIISYGAEGLSGGRTHNLYVINNTSVNDYGAGRHIDIAGGTALAKIVNNLFIGGGTVPSGPNVTNNLATSNPMLENISNYIYRLTANSPARNTGIAPGTGDGYSLTPVYQYLHANKREIRPIDATIDIGAYEYVSP